MSSSETEPFPVAAFFPLNLQELELLERRRPAEHPVTDDHLAHAVGEHWVRVAILAVEDFEYHAPGRAVIAFG